MIDLFTYFIYITLLCILMLLTHCKARPMLPCGNNFNFKHGLNIKHLIALLILSVVVGFRYKVGGGDWEGYKYWFEYFSNYPNIKFSEQYFEPGFFYINKIIGILGAPYQLMFLIVAFISWFFIFKSVPKIILPLFIYFLFVDEFFFWSMNGVRQFVAISIFIYSVKFIISKDIYKFFLVIFVASLFHYTALLLLPLYFFPFDKKFNPNFWGLLFVLSLLFAKTPFLIDGLELLFLKLSRIIPLFSTYIHYFEGQHYEVRQFGGTGLGYCFRILITIFILFFSKRIILRYPDTKFFIILFMIGAVVNNLFFSIQIIGRFNNYLIIMRTVVLAIIVYDLLQSKKESIFAIGIIILFFMLFLTYIYNSSNMCSPYNWTI